VGNGLQPILGAASVALRPIRAPVKPVQLPQKVAPIPPTSLDDIDAAVQRLELKKAEWVALPASARADLLEECIQIGLEEAPALAATSVKTKGSYGSGLGEELCARSHGHAHWAR
jgi:acyl-CoA reductase-like NAD-dependent aldehyde dehydrogenase